MPHPLVTLGSMQVASGKMWRIPSMIVPSGYRVFRPKTTIDRGSTKSSPMPRKEAFPTTQQTWIGQTLVQGDRGRANVNRHVMEVYSWPLTVYYRGTRDRWLGEPDEIVQGFFADRLARSGFFTDWQRSRLPLRRWLINAFCFYLSEMRRRSKRDRSAQELGESAATTESDPGTTMDRAFVVSIVRAALSTAENRCKAEGLDAHWRIFMRHHHNGEAYQHIAADADIGPARAAVMCRTASRKFRSALRDMMARDGAPQHQIDREIQSLLEISQS
jgi:hypothetical protein